jgi:hypothetical protein
LVLFGLSVLYPQTVSFGSLPQIQLGGLGVFAALAYVAGHLTQAVGNLLEGVYWRFWGGMPSDWVRTGKMLSTKQYERLAATLESRVGTKDLATIAPGHWFPVTREIYAAVAQAKRADRVEVFNGLYGLSRGIAAAGVILLLAVPFRDPRAWGAMLGLAVLTVVATYRMHRFGKTYARELFVQFLDLKGT